MIDLSTAPIVVPALNIPKSLALLATRQTAYTDEQQREIIETYNELCERAGVLAPMAVAQAILETAWFSSWWSSPPRHNFAGIGVTGESRVERPPTGRWAEKNGVWYRGYSFATIRDGVRAHLALLLIYATAPERRTETQNALIAQSPFADLAATHRYTGKAPTWAGLNGKWAVPGKTYAQSIAKIAALLI